MVSKYFRKAGVPQVDDDGNADPRRATATRYSARSAPPARSSTASPATWRWWGESTATSHRPRMPRPSRTSSPTCCSTRWRRRTRPQWFNTGLHHDYGITGPSQGFWYVDPETEEMTASPDSYSRPAPHACFIQSVDDDLVNEGGIMDLWVREARLFKFGSGTGSNFSNIRAEGEPLSGGGKSSGLMSLPQGRRPGRRRHQVGRHHPARRQDGHPRHRPSRRRDLHQLEGRRGEEGQGARRCRLPRRLQRRGLRHRLRPELQQLGAPLQRVRRGRPRRRRLGPHRPHRRLGHEDGQGPRPVAPDRRRRLAVRRSRRAVPHHDQRVAHLPRRRRDPGLQPVLASTCSSTTRRATWRA